MYKQLFSLTAACCLASQPLFAADKPAGRLEQCPDIHITSLFPLKVDPIPKWRISVQEIAPTSYSHETPALEDVMSYETHVITNNVDNINRDKTVTLYSCQYGIHWNKYKTNLYSKKSTSDYSLITLKPAPGVPITISIPSILDDNLTGWTIRTKHFLSISYIVWSTWFDCYHDRITDTKCTWVTVPTVNPGPSSKDAAIYSIP